MNRVRVPDGFAALTAEYDMLPQGARVLCAVSGGADSMCLLHLLSRAAPEGGFTVIAAHFNHGLRGEESQRDEDFVREQCARWSIPLTAGRGEVRAFAAREGYSVEEAARILRYAFLEEAGKAENCTRIATAHNADDNLETLLLRLTRGTGLHGLAGIPPRRGEIVRPLLCCSRADILAYLEENGVPHVEDSTNSDEAYARNRLRRQVIPVLRELNPQLSACAAQTIGHLRADNDYLNAQAAAACEGARREGDTLVIGAGQIAGLSPAIAVRAVRRLLELTGDGNTDCSAAHLRAVVELARGEDPSAQVCLPHGRLARREYGKLLLTARTGPPPLFAPTALKTDGETFVEGVPWRVRCRPVRCPDRDGQTAGAIYLARRAMEEPVVLRPRQTGDRISLPRRNTKTIKKLFIDEHIPRWERERIPVLADRRGVAAVAGFGPDRSRQAKPGEDAYELLFWKREGIKWNIS